MQQLCEVKIETYLAADNPFDVVSRPDVCERCKKERFHRHGTYWRYIEKKHVRVARFLCAVCGLTVSMLPMFVLPYRNQLVEAVDRYFRAENEVRIEMRDGDVLRRYWRQWVGHVGSLQRDTAWPPERPLAREPRGYWQQMGRAAGNMQAAQRHLTGCFGASLLRRYACHKKPERIFC
jgi:hypothetical protein